MQDFFEQNHCVVQDVNTENDFGKDLYVDLTRDDLESKQHTITGVTAAIQVKSGASYRTATGYRIPIDQHLRCWRDSTVPVLGVVVDSERDVMVWINLTEHLRTRTDDLKHVPIDRSSVLDSSVLVTIEESVRHSAVAHHPLAQLWRNDRADVEQGVWDCMALGRRDVRVFRGLRASIPWIDEGAMPAVIRVLSSLASHPDRAWTGRNWIPASISGPARATFRWTVEEVIRLTRAAGDEWERGDIGQHVVVMLGEDPDVTVALTAAIAQVYSIDVNEAWMLFCLYLHFRDDEAMQAFEAEIQRYPSFRAHPAFSAVRETIELTGFLPIAD